MYEAIWLLPATLVIGCGPDNGDAMSRRPSGAVGSASSGAAGQSYYVSQSEGNDGNDGLTTATPWKTLSKASARTYVSGESVLLKRGDTWNEAFFPKGNGLYWHNDWITLGSYGSGARPILDGGGTLDTGVRFDGATFTGGWRVQDLQIQNFRVAGIDAEVTAGKYANGLQIDNCFITLIQPVAGYPAWRTDSTQPNRILPDYNLYLSTGIASWWVNNLRVTNTTVSYCNASFNTTGGNDVYFSGNTFDHMHKIGGSICAATVIYNVGPVNLIKRTVKNITFTNNHVSYTGYLNGFWAGIAGVQLIGTEDTLFDRNEVDHTAAPFGSDQVALDFETGNVRTTVTNNNFHDNMGPALLFYQNGVFAPISAQTGTVITDNVFNNNGLAAPTQLPAIVRAVPTTIDAIQWKRNVVTYASGQAFLFGDQLGLPNQTNSLQPTWVSDNTNTVTNGTPTPW